MAEQAQKCVNEVPQICIFSFTGKVLACQVIILSPTRELAEQSQKVCLALGDYMNVQVHCCVGGKRVSDDIRALEAGMEAEGSRGLKLKKLAFVKKILEYQSIEVSLSFSRLRVSFVFSKTVRIRHEEFW